jgi:hypothetical protein
MRFLLFWLIPLVVGAADNRKKYTLDDLDWGKVIYGTPLTELTIKEKGVVVFLFVYNDEIHPEVTLNKFQADLHETKGNIVALAVETSGGNPGREMATSKKVMELTKFLKKFDYEFSVAVGMRKRPAGFESTLPYCYVMNQKKSIIYSGPPRGDEYKEALEKAATPVEKSGDKENPADDPKKDEKPKKAA